jgi:predicted Zn finger-like uncharacterized protein
MHEVSLATRCAQCGTVFRVVQDQLKVSEGWVRCGRCQQVFNALEGLFDLEGTSGPMPLRSELSAAEVVLPSDRTHAHADHDDGDAVGFGADETLSPPSSVSRLDGELLQTSEFHGENVADERVVPAVPGHDTPDDSQVDVTAFDPEGFNESAALERVGLVSRPSEDVAAVDTPEFLRHAERAARWHSPAARRSLSVAVVFLAALLTTQIGLHHRDALAAHWPATMPWLDDACAPLGCQVEPLRRLSAFAVESSALLHVEGSSLHRLQLTLHRRADLPLMPPAVDLMLTDTRGDVVARRTLRASEFMAGQTSTVGADAELQWQAVLDLGDRRISGYTVELFYP